MPDAAGGDAGAAEAEAVAAAAAAGNGYCAFHSSSLGSTCLPINVSHVQYSLFVWCLTDARQCDLICIVPFLTR